MKMKSVIVCMIIIFGSVLFCLANEGKKDYYTDSVDKAIDKPEMHPPPDDGTIRSWMLSREELRNELAKMIREWGETGFYLDDELVRHVIYFYKYHSIVDYRHTNDNVKRSKKFLPDIKKIFHQFSIPEELAFAVPFVESGFKNNVKSNKNALGMFQFLKDTAISYGLLVNAMIDERKDYQKAARACAMYLRENCNNFGSIVLSLGSYHHGSATIEKIVKKTTELNFGSILDLGILGQYSKEYVPRCLALALLYRMMNKHQISQLPNLNVTYRNIKRSVDIYDLQKKVPHLYTLNPDLRDSDKTYTYVSTGGYLLIQGISDSGIGSEKKIYATPSKASDDQRVASVALKSDLRQKDKKVQKNPVILSKLIKKETAEDSAMIPEKSESETRQNKDTEIITVNYSNSVSTPSENSKQKDRHIISGEERLSRSFNSVNQLIIIYEELSEKETIGYDVEKEIISVMEILISQCEDLERAFSHSSLPDTKISIATVRKLSTDVQHKLKDRQMKQRFESNIKTILGAYEKMVVEYSNAVNYDNNNKKDMEIKISGIFSQIVNMQKELEIIMSKCTRCPHVEGFSEVLDTLANDLKHFEEEISSYRS